MPTGELNVWRGKMEAWLKIRSPLRMEEGPYCFRKNRPYYTQPPRLQWVTWALFETFKHTFGDTHTYTYTHNSNLQINTFGDKHAYLQSADKLQSSSLTIIMPCRSLPYICTLSTALGECERRPVGQHSHKHAHTQAHACTTCITRN